MRQPWRIYGVVLAVACALGAALYVVFWRPNVFQNGAGRIFTVSRGQSFASIVDSLAAQGFIRSAFTFRLAGSLYGGATEVKVGRYTFVSGMSNVEMLRDLIAGESTAAITVTIPEGLTARQQAGILARALGIDSAAFVAIAFDPSSAASMGVEGRSLEGYLFPETYRFHWQTDEREVVTQMVEQFRAFYDDSLSTSVHELGWTMKQAVTVASIVEGEAQLVGERPIISGVYHNRLRKGMRLEADPTVRYFIEDGPRRILYSDLRIDNPYNTYRYKGLPPGPVNNPGRASLHAALYPSNHSYLFFVADGKGGHWFSTSYLEHLRNVRRYRRQK